MMASVMGFMSPVQPPAGPVRWEKEGVAAFVEKQDLLQGNLYIAESHVSWINASGQGFNIPYQAITVHAVSKDLSAFPHECLYLMIDSEVMAELKAVLAPGQGGDAPQDNDSDNGIEEEEGLEVREIRFVPQDKTLLQTMFEAMSQCQALHPDPDDSDDAGVFEQEDGADEEEEEAEGEMEGGGGGDGDDAMDTGQFDDADMDPEH